MADEEKAEMGLTVVDGTVLRGGDLRLPIADGAVSGTRLLEMAESEAAARLFGLPLPDRLRSATLRRLGGGTGRFVSMEFNDNDSLEKMIQEYLLALAEEVDDDPLVVSVFDGSALRVFLEDEDDFAMLAENLFTDLDINDTGKLSNSEVHNVFAHMGEELGVPPLSVSGDLLSNILKKHETEGEEKLGQAQFAHLLQPILQDLADALAENHVVVIQDIKVINGSRLKKILDDKKLFDDITGRMFQEWEQTSPRAWNNQTLRDLLLGKRSELGLPPFESNETIGSLYDVAFSDIFEEEVAGNLNRESFQGALKVIFNVFIQLFEAKPVFIDRES